MVTFPADRYQSLEVVDLQGRILQHVVIAGNESRKEISLGNYAAGVYLINLKKNGSTDVLRAIRK